MKARSIITRKLAISPCGICLTISMFIVCTSELWVFLYHISDKKPMYVKIHVQNVNVSLSLSIQDPVTVSQDCSNGRNIRASYELSYTNDSGTLITTCVVNGTECSNGTCHHELHNQTADRRCQPPVSRFSSEGVTVSVMTMNVVGRSNPAISRRISKFSEVYNCMLEDQKFMNAYICAT